MKPIYPTVLVTGSSRGIGKAIAHKFALKNYNVVLNCINSVDIMNSFAAELKKINKNILAIQCDVSNYESVMKMYEQIIKTFGKIDILVNNASISQIKLFNDTNILDWNNIINNNIISVFNCSHVVLPKMIQDKSGKIINISSIWGNVGASCETIYSASKGAINAFTKSLAKEVAPSKISVNAIACGAIETDMNNFLTKEEKKEFENSIPYMRFGYPEEVSELVFSIASQKCDYLTGQIITLDGGLT